MAVSIHDRPDTPPADEPAEVIECSQWINLQGLNLAEVVALSQGRHPAPCVRWVKPGESPPWAHSWYREDAEGKLQLWRYNWDSSD